MWGFESNKHNLAYPMARREVLVKKKKPSVDINFIESSSSSSHDASSEESEASTHVNRLLKSSHSFVGDSDPRISQIRVTGHCILDGHVVRKLYPSVVL